MRNTIPAIVSTVNTIVINQLIPSIVLFISLFSVPVLTAQNLTKNSSLSFSLLSTATRRIVIANRRKNKRKENGRKRDPKYTNNATNPSKIEVKPEDFFEDKFLINNLKYERPSINQTITPINPLLDKVVNTSLEPVTKVVFPKAIVASVCGLNMLYPIPKESFPNPTNPLKKSSTIEELETLQEISAPNLIGVIVVNSLPNNAFLNGSY